MKPFKQGMVAFRQGKLDNPYEENTEAYRGWQFGFDRAYFANLEEVRKRERESGG